MTSEPTDYLTVSGHLSGPVAAAFKHATPDRGDASKYVRRAVEKLLESEGFMDRHHDNEDIHAAVAGAIAARVPPAEILAALSTLTRQRAAEPAGSR